MTGKALYVKWQKSYFGFSNPNVSELSHLLEFMIYLDDLPLTKVDTMFSTLYNGKGKQQDL